MTKQDMCLTVCLMAEALMDSIIKAVVVTDRNDGRNITSKTRVFKNEESGFTLGLRRRSPVPCFEATMWAVSVGFSVDASETPAVSARSLVSTEGRSVRKSQTCRRSYLLLAGSSRAYLLLAGSSVKLIFIGWLLLRTACKPCRVEVEVEEEVEAAAVPGWLGPAQIAQSPVWEKHTTLFPPPEPRQTEFLLSLLSPFAPHFLSSVPPTSTLPLFWPHDPFYTSFTHLADAVTRCFKSQNSHQHFKRLKFVGKYIFISGAVEIGVCSHLVEFGRVCSDPEGIKSLKKEKLSQLINRAAASIYIQLLSMIFRNKISVSCLQSSTF